MREAAHQVERRATADRRPWFAARVATRRFVRAVARVGRPLIGERAFEALYGLGRLGYLPRIEHPTTFAEKLLWLKRHYRHPLMPLLTDKLAVREHVAREAPECRTPIVYQVAATATDFDFGSLPQRAVVKSTHGSGHVAYWTPDADQAALRRSIEGWLATRYEAHANEWVYAGSTPRVFAEEDLRDGTGRPPVDFKFMVLNGVVHHVQVVEGRGERLAWRIFDRDWQLLPVLRPNVPGGPPSIPRGPPPERPARLTTMLAVSERLGAQFPFVRIDFYVRDDALYIGEMTFFPASGHPEFIPASFDLELGRALTLPPAQKTQEWR